MVWAAIGCFLAKPLNSLKGALALLLEVMIRFSVLDPFGKKVFVFWVEYLGICFEGCGVCLRCKRSCWGEEALIWSAAEHAGLLRELSEVVRNLQGWRETYLEQRKTYFEERGTCFE